MRLFCISVLSLVSAMAQLPVLPAPSAASTSRTVVAPLEDQGASLSMDTVIGVDDTLTLNVLHAPELTRNWRVGSSGNLQLPVLGTVKAAGRTIEELETDLSKGLERYMKAPNVTVTIADRRSAPITFTGGVEHPGTLQLQMHRKLFDAVTLAGGLKPSASTVILTRPVENGPIPLSIARATLDGRFTVAKIPAADLLNSRTLAANIELKPNDVVDVQVQQPRVVYVIGEVAKPGMIELLDHATVPLTLAVSRAGGPTRLAMTSKVVLRKVTDDGGYAETSEIDFGKIYKGKLQDLEIGPGYVVWVPANEMKAYLQAASIAAINAGIFAGMQVLIHY